MAPSFLKTLTAAVGLYASLAIAAPLQKRVIVWETVTDVVVETVEVTLTVNGVPQPPKTVAPPEITPAQQPSYQAPPPPPPPAPTTTSSAAPPPPPPPPPAPTSTQPAPGVFKEEHTSTSAPPPPPPPPSSAAAPSSSAPPPPPPPPPAAPSVEAPKTQPSPSPAPLPPVQLPDVKAPASPSTGGGQSYSGDMTYYNGGLGACGTNINTDTDDAVAISALLMGPLSNTSPFCGKTITINFKGKTVTAKILDKCPECAHGALDMTKHLFDQFADQAEGRLPGVTWTIN